MNNGKKVQPEIAGKLEDSLALLKDGFVKAAKTYEGAVLTGKENAEALLASADLTKAGIDAIRAEIVSASLRSLNTGLATAEALFAVRSAPEFFQIQSEFVKSAFETYKTQCAAVSEMLQQTAKKAAAPIQSRVAASRNAFSFAA